MDRAEQADAQRLREVVCERGGVRICCHDPPHGEAARPSLRTFHTVSLRGLVNRALRDPLYTLTGVRRSCSPSTQCSDAVARCWRGSACSYLPSGLLGRLPAAAIASPSRVRAFSRTRSLSRSAWEVVRSATAYARQGEALARKVALPLLLDLGRQLLLARLLAAAGRALWTEE